MRSLSARWLCVCPVLLWPDVEAMAQDFRPPVQGPPEGARRHLKESSTYTVQWEAPAEWGTDAEIEVDSGRYNCCYEREPALEWYRIRRVGDRVEVLHFETGGGNDPVEAGKVRIERAQMSPAAQVELLHDLAWISAARLEPREPASLLMVTGCSSWSYVRISGGSRASWEDAWAGGSGSYGELRYAKSRACVARVEKALSVERFESSEVAPADRNRILESLSTRTYAGRPWEAFGGAESLTDPYRRLVVALDGDPDARLPTPREEVRIVIEGTPTFFEDLEHLTVWKTSGQEVAIHPSSCLRPLADLQCHAVRLAPGEYAVALDAPDYEPIRIPIVVRRGDPVKVVLQLVRRDSRR
ncbi:MAG TPA: hypothetical protein VKF62_11940 [Planctomycetota bacterium]|nr:hypothetical protein [Planctomycetota bacterium]